MKKFAPAPGIKKVLTRTWVCGIIVSVDGPVGAWCNGNTWVSKTFVEGSNPSAPANSKSLKTRCFRGFLLAQKQRLTTIQFPSIPREVEPARHALHYGVLRAGARRIGADVGGAGGQDGGSPAMGEYKGSDNFPPPAGFALDKRCGKGYNGRTVFLRDDEGHDFAHPAPQRGCAAG